MARRNQPYFPLYVQDYLTDERLLMCSWQTQGIYIRILCNLHKQEIYGAILFKQTFKQNESIINYFASILCKLIACQYTEMLSALSELLDNGVLKIDEEKLYQKRMYLDGLVSIKRSEAAKKGGGNPALKPKKNTKNLFKQNYKQNTENEIEYDNENNNENNKIGAKTFSSKINEEFEAFRRAYPGTKRGYDTEIKTFKKHSDWSVVLPMLLPALERETQWRENRRQSGEFCPQWANMQTWINQRRWEQELTKTIIGYGQRNNTNPQRQTKRTERESLVAEIFARNGVGPRSDTGRYCEDIVAEQL